MKAKSYSRTIPVPIGGWNTRDPIAEMPDTDAIRMINMIPRNDTIELRAGYRVHTPSGLGSGAVETLAEFSDEDGTRKLIAAANGNIYDCSTLDASATDLSGSFGAFSNNRWQTAMFKNTLILVNGADQPKKYDGSSLTDATYTGISDDSVLISVSVYKGSLYFVQKNSMSIWYGVTGEITGALTEFPIGDFYSRGGYLVFAGSYTRNTGQGLEDLFIAVTNMGEVLVFTGSNPADTDWGLVAHYYMPIPLGNRAFFNYNADLVVVTQLGAIPFSRVLSGVDAGSEEAFITDKIRTAFRSATKLYRANFGWDAIVYPEGELIYINIPLSATQYEQYAVNIHTGGWTRLTGMNAVCWSLFNEKPYFGGSSGKVYQADYGNTDNGMDIRFEVKPAFNYFGNRAQEKLFSLVRPIITAEDTVAITCNVDTDFRDRAVVDEIVTTEGAGSEWDDEDWDEGEWGGGGIITDNWYGIGDIGRCASVKMSGFARNITFTISAIDVIYETGGFI